MARVVLTVFVFIFSGGYFADSSDPVVKTSLGDIIGTTITLPLELLP